MKFEHLNLCRVFANRCRHFSWLPRMLCSSTEDKKAAQGCSSVSSQSAKRGRNANELEQEVTSAAFEGRRARIESSPLTQAHVFGTFDVGDVDVELAELLARPLDALVHRLDDLLGVLLHPSDGRPDEVM